jgi:hypothetical protein
LIRISGTWVSFYLNNGKGGFTTARGDFKGMPSPSKTRKLLFADMNGNGTTDIIWITSDWHLNYLDLIGQPNAGMLSRIDNGMGFVTQMAYRSSTNFAIEAKRDGKPWRFP